MKILQLPKPRRNAGFSLVEISIAIALIASVMITLMLVMGMASDAAGRATRLTTMGHILTDVHQRMEGAPLQDGPIQSSLSRNGAFFYDVEGVFVPPTAPVERLLRRTYRVDVTLSTPDAEQFPNAKGLKAVTMQMKWPVDPLTGDHLAKGGHNVESMTYFVTSLTGPSWEEVDSNYEPTIDL
ncbi:MAG: type II secretion system protein [Verrucomicrobiota bacterium]